MSSGNGGRERGDVGGHTGAVEEPRSDPLVAPFQDVDAAAAVVEGWPDGVRAL